MPKRQRKRAVRRTYGPCVFDCSREATHKETQTCDPCYNVCRRWKNDKTDEQRAERQAFLLLSQSRMEAVGSIRIGTTRAKAVAAAQRRPSARRRANGASHRGVRP